MEQNNNNNNNNNNNAYIRTPEEQSKELPKERSREQSETQAKRTFTDKNRAMLTFKGILEVSYAREAVSAAVETVIKRIESEGIEGIEVGDSVFLDMCAFALMESTKKPKLNPERLLYGVFKVLITDYVCKLNEKKEEAK